KHFKAEPTAFYHTALVRKGEKPVPSVGLAHAAVIYAAKRQIRIDDRDEHVVDSHPSGDGVLHQVINTLIIVTHDIERKWSFQFMDDGRYRFPILKSDNGQNRPEYFFLHYVHVTGDTCE